MSRNKCLISAGIFILLTLIKLFVPGAAENIRSQAQHILGRDTDYTEVLLYISSLVPDRWDYPAAAPEQETPAEPEPEPEAVQAPSAPPYTPRGMRTYMPEVKAPAGDELTLSVKERMSGGTIAAPEPLPEAVQTFLDSQALYSDYEQPANVSYLMPELPFDYSAPVRGSESSGFGYRLHPILDEVKFHYGTDMAAWTGEPVYGFAAGTVTLAASSDSFGNYIIIDHGGGWQSLYAHCSQIDVEAGQSVRCGEQIGLVGATGQVTGPHLHFELTHNGVYVNPEYYINCIWQV